MIFTVIFLNFQKKSIVYQFKKRAREKIRRK